MESSVYHLGFKVFGAVDAEAQKRRAGALPDARTVIMSGFARPSDVRSPASSEHARPTQSLRGDRGAPNDAAARRWRP